MATDLSKLQPIFTDLTAAERKRIIDQIQRLGHADRCRQALVTLNERQFVIHHGDLWIDDDVLGYVNLIVDGDLIVNGTYGDSEQMLIVLGDMRCENMVATGGLYVRGDLVCGGLSYHYYNDWSMEVEGTLAARAHIEDDRGGLAGAWQVEARGDIGCSAEAACCLLGFRDGRSDPDEDDENDDGDDACATTGSAGEKPTLPAYYRCGEMLAERRRLGEAIFAIPLPPMAKLVARFGEDWAWRKRLWNPDRARDPHDIDWRVRASTVLVPRTGPWAAPDPAVLDHLAGDADARVRTVIASLPDLPSSLVTQLYDDPDTTVRNRISRCQTLSTEIWQRLALDADPKVRLSVAGQAFRGDPPFNEPEQQAVRNRILQTLMLDSVDAVREEAANAWQAFAFYEQHAATMAKDPLPSVRRLLARITRNPAILSTLVIDSESSVIEDALANPNTPGAAIEACCQRVISEIIEIDKIETVDIDPMDHILRSQDPVFKAQAEAMRIKEQRLDAQLDQMSALGARPELPERFVSAFVDFEIRFDLRLFDDAACMSPPQMLKRWRAKLASEDCGDAQCPCHHEERTFLQHLEPCSHDASVYREFFHHVIEEGARNHRGQALASRHCPPELLAQAVQAHLDGADDGEYDYAIRYMAANPALNDATRQILVQRVIKQRDHEIISGLARNPTVSAVEWRTIGANTQSPHYAEARDALWLWHGEDIGSAP